MSLTIDSVVSTDNLDGTFTSTMMFTAKKDVTTATPAGTAMTAAEIAALPQKAFYTSTYDSATRKFNASVAYVSSSNRGLAATYVPTATPGQFTLKVSPGFRFSLVR